MNYDELINQHPVLFECFFAFSNDQFEKGKREAGIEGKKIYNGGSGLYGTQEGIDKLFNDYEEIDKKISSECQPQDVYDYEFNNHECSYTCNDSEAISIVFRIFGKERTKTVKLRFAYVKIDNLE